MKRITLLALLSVPFCALAQTSDADIAQLIKDRKFVEAEKMTLARISSNSRDDMAIWFLASVVANDAAKRDKAIVVTEACVNVLPESAKCHHALGRLYGAAAMSSGLVNGIKFASRIKDEFARTVEIEPGNFDARRDLNQFYLQAPGLAGGSVRKAIENSEALGRLNAAQGQLLRVEIHIYQKEFDKAEALLATVKPAGDETSTRMLAQGWVSLGFAMINEKQAAKAQSLFERQLANDMNNASLHFGLGRAQFENQALDAAIASMERALKIDSKISAHYRLGIAYQAKGDRPRAIVAFQQFLTYMTSGKAADDAKLRLESLRLPG